MPMRAKEKFEQPVHSIAHSKRSRPLRNYVDAHRRR
jgi:hypothetical protein